MRAPVRLAALAAAALLTVLPAAPAWAHADFVSSDPVDGSVVAAAPKQVTMTFTESASAKASPITVTDGCGRDSVAQVASSGKKLVVAIRGGQPGRWQVGYTTVSTVDGHINTPGQFSFTVDGTPDCSAAASKSQPAAKRAAPVDASSSGSGLTKTLLVVGLAALLAIGLALVVRRRGSRPAS